MDSLQALGTQRLLEGVVSCNLKFDEHCVLDKKTKVNLALQVTAWEVFLIVFTLMFGVLLRLHHLEAIGILSL